MLVQDIFPIDVVNLTNELLALILSYICEEEWVKCLCSNMLYFISCSLFANDERDRALRKMYCLAKKGNDMWEYASRENLIDVIQFLIECDKPISLEISYYNRKSQNHKVSRLTKQYQWIREVKEECIKHDVIINFLNKKNLPAAKGGL